MLSDFCRRGFARCFVFFYDSDLYSQEMERNDPIFPSDDLHENDINVFFVPLWKP